MTAQLDERMRAVAVHFLPGEGISAKQVNLWADEVTALIIERDALRRQVEELLAEARHEPERDPPF